MPRLQLPSTLGQEQEGQRTEPWHGAKQQPVTPCLLPQQGGPVGRRAGLMVNVGGLQVLIWPVLVY